MSFYKDKNVLVTGGTGLIGKPLVDMLIKKGSKVRIASLDSPSRAHREAEFHRVDLTEYGNCMEVCNGIDYVFNLVGIKCSPKTVQERPATIFNNLILFDTNMMRAAHSCGVERYLYTSTTGVYGPAEVFVEDDVWKTFPSEKDWQGGWAKRMGEVQAEAYELEHGWDKIAIVRPANVYGPHDNFDSNAMVVPSLIKRAFDGEDPFTVWGDGAQIRDFIYSKDVARGMMMALENCQGPFKPLNLGSGKEHTIKELVEIITGNLDPKPEVIWDTSKPSGDRKRLMDISRAESLLRWKPQYTLKEGIEETMEWYKNNNDVSGGRFDYFNTD